MQFKPEHPDDAARLGRDVGVSRMASGLMGRVGPYRHDDLAHTR